MKIRADRRLLADNLAWVAQAIPKNPNVAALAGMHLEAVDGNLTAKAFDYDVAHTATVEVDVVSAGECLVSGHFLATMISAIKGDEVELVLDGARLTITAGRSTYQTQVLRMEDYPSLPSFPARVGTVDAESLAGIVNAVKARVDDGSPFDQVRGLRLEGQDSGLIAVGASQQAIGVATTAWAEQREFVATVPVRIVAPAIKGMSGDVSVGCEDGLFGLSDDTRSVTMRGFKADDFHDWRKLLRAPADDAWSVDVDVADLLDATRRAAMLADETVPLVMAFGEELEISVAGTGAGGGTEYLDVQSPEPNTIGMHPRYLIDALTAIPSGEVQIGFAGTGVKPLMLRPHDHPGLQFVVMPKRVPGGAA